MSQADIVVRLEQRSEGPLQVHEGKLFSYRYAYARSADSQREDEPGQDYLVYRDLENSFVFAACDGVSQSYFGDLAARYLGDALVAWLVQEIPDSSTSATIQRVMTAHLANLTTAATRQIDQHNIPAEPGLLHEVLLDKKTRGSETMFVCGRLDAPSPGMPEGRVVLAWMGDMRLHLWRASGPVELGGRHETSQRWSSKRGPVGGPVNTYIGPLLLAGDPVIRLVVYSDGLSNLDSELDREFSNHALQQIVWSTKASASSDDVTYLELSTSSTWQPARLAEPLLATVPVVTEHAAPQPIDTPQHLIPLDAAPAAMVPVEPIAPRRRAVWPLALAGFILVGLLGGLVWLAPGLLPFGSAAPTATAAPVALAVPPTVLAPTIASHTPSRTLAPTIQPSETPFQVMVQPATPTPSGTADATAMVPDTAAAFMPIATISVFPGPPSGALAQARSRAFDGQTVTVGGSLSPADQARFAWSMVAFEEQTGIDVQLLNSANFEEAIRGQIEDDTAPDIGDFSQPAILARLVSEGKVIDLETFMSEEWLEQQYEPFWLDLSRMPSPDGELTAGVWHRFNGRSLVWYPKAAFDAAGYVVPQSWGDLETLVSQMVEQEQTPWCGAIEPETAGEQAADWTEELLLRSGSPEDYDNWVEGDLAFSSPAVRSAISSWESIWPYPGYPSAGGLTGVGIRSGDPTAMLTEPPGCWLRYQGDLSTDLFTSSGRLGQEIDFFYLPGLSVEGPQPFMVDGHIMALLRDRPEAQALLEYFTLPESAQGWLTTGGALAAHKTAVPDMVKEPAALRLAEFLAQPTSSRHFDGSKLMPVEVGSVSFPLGMASYLRDEKDLDTILREIDASWPVATTQQPYPAPENG